MPELGEQEMLENVPYEEIMPGQRASYSKTLRNEDIRLFALVSGDVNPVHLDAGYAADTPFGEPIAHGMWTASLVSAALALRLPGPGCIYLQQTLEFRRPVKVGDTVTASLRVIAKDDVKRIVVIECDVVNQKEERVLRGEARVIAAAEKIRCAAPHPGTVQLSP